MNKPFSCPLCGSDRIQKARIISRAGIPISAEVARILSPPVEPTSDTRPAGELSIYIAAFLLFMGIYTQSTSHSILTGRVGLVFLIMGATLFLLGCLLLTLSQIELNSKEPKYKEDYAKWERLWYCSRCRNTFYDS
jgi:predicted nucleic-acid-binding Zn-ribbon protein